MKKVTNKYLIEKEERKYFNEKSSKSENKSLNEIVFSKVNPEGSRSGNVTLSKGIDTNTVRSAVDHKKYDQR